MSGQQMEMSPSYPVNLFAFSFYPKYPYFTYSSAIERSVALINSNKAEKH